ncbi:hypothetical protein TCE0_042f14147 [Talaromyces pinophilus]|uniref:Uncharacterized protein n=1 Tax=Talaromyces pinophilus TaxID=128442 RepID=A0A6V8HIS8_TALPI|nr:hypothetical protein TCE0_042f14147 [Talaromyces pinophilus]
MRRIYRETELQRTLSGAGLGFRQCVVITEQSIDRAETRETEVVLNVAVGSGRRKSRQEQSDKTEGGAGAASQKAQKQQASKQASARGRVTSTDESGPRPTMRRNGRAAGASGLTLARDRRRQNLHVRAVVGWSPRSVSLAPLPSLPLSRQSAPAASATAPIAVCQASPLASGGWEQEQRRENG